MPDVDLQELRNHAVEIRKRYDDWGTTIDAIDAAIANKNIEERSRAVGIELKANKEKLKRILTEIDGANLQLSEKTGKVAKLNEYLVSGYKKKEAEQEKELAKQFAEAKKEEDKALSGIRTKVRNAKKVLEDYMKEIEEAKEEIAKIRESLVFN